MTHALKTWPEFYKLVESGEKAFEVRKMDRPFKVGETLLLQEFDNEKQEFTGNETTRVITCILRDPKFGIKTGYCVMGLREIEFI